MPIDTTKRLAKIHNHDTHTVTAADVSFGSVNKQYPLAECILTNVAVNSHNRAIDVDACLYSPGESYISSELLMQREPTRGANYDIIWEGEKYVPHRWILHICMQNSLVAGDIIEIDWGYDLCVQL